MSWSEYAKHGERCCPPSAKFIGSGVFGSDGGKWATHGADYGAFGAQIAQGGPDACKKDFLGPGQNMMRLSEADGTELYKKGGNGAAIKKTKKAVAFVMVEGTPQDALIAVKGIADALEHVGF